MTMSLPGMLFENQGNMTEVNLDAIKLENLFAGLSVTKMLLAHGLSD